MAKYSTDSGRTDQYRDGIRVSSYFWANKNDYMGCCGDMVLIDYKQLNCSDDSSRIYHSEKTTLSINTYQQCKRVFATGVPNYNSIKCIQTRQVNLFKNTGDKLYITNYFGQDVGLIFRQETRYDKSGKFLIQETLRLVSHNF